MRHARLPTSPTEGSSRTTSRRSPQGGGAMRTIASLLAIAAATLTATGPVAADQRDFNCEWSAGYGYPDWLQTFGWKEAEDVLAMGRFLAAQPGVTSLGVVGFSLGAQDAVLALAVDGQEPSGHAVFSAGL